MKTKHSTNGDWHKVLIQLHETYGPAVRFAPNELLCISQAYQDIMLMESKEKHHGLKGRPTIPVPKPTAKALRLQEEVVAEYMDLLVSQIAQRKDEEKGLNMSQWYNWLTFDIIGDLAFGESF
ncbi:hypothetical protein EYC84_004286 [Monilinia fructicola]|uniref:Uncharacterized protein n=1 Tax=Monilinia fructicola TaxID=38448 RepID=A0A5M9JZV1_MONFR|nr:hypothetical protein EYC84_004286 [Monilinia fructicola]